MGGWNALPEGGKRDARYAILDTRRSVLVGVKRHRRPGEEKGAGNKEKGDRKRDKGARRREKEGRKANSEQRRAVSRERLAGMLLKKRLFFFEIVE